MDIVKLATELITAASIAHTFLPPWEVFDDFPVLQKYYKLLIYFVGYAALNGRSTVHPSISTDSGSKPSAAVLNGSQAPPK